MSKTIYNILCHSADLDGYASFAVATDYLINKNVPFKNINIIPINYNYSIEHLLSYYTKYPQSIKIITIIGDFTPKYEDFLDIIELSDCTYWADHHINSKSIFCRLKSLMKKDSTMNIKLFINFDETNTKSGCVLLYELLHEHNQYNLDTIPKLLHIISDGDTYRWEIPGSKSVLQLLTLINWTNIDILRDVIFDYKLFGFEFDYKHEHEFIQLLYNIGSELYLNRKNQINHIIKYNTYFGKLKLPYSDELIRFGITNCTENNIISDLGNKISVYCKGIGIVYSDNRKTKERRYSLRCNAEIDIDVNSIAQLFNGGGHRLASGFKLSFNQIDQFTKLIQK